MSAFGGDSWAREAHYRKRRVDDLMMHQNHLSSSSSSSSSYKKLSNGKFACLVCPNNPLLDSSLMLSMHSKGSRHIAAESRLKESELWKQEEIKKRIALSNDCTATTASLTTCSQGKPLIEQTREATFEALCNQRSKLNNINGHRDVKLNKGNASFFSRNTPAPKRKSEAYMSLIAKSEAYMSLIAKSEPSVSSIPSEKKTAKADGKMLVEQQVELQKLREKELKFREAGWKRDCHGKWFRDENVEFDSDEEDPNDYFT